MGETALAEMARKMPILPTETGMHHSFQCDNMPMNILPDGPHW